MDQREQFEVMATIRAYAKQIAELQPDDIRPSTAHQRYRLAIVRMHELQQRLDCVS